MKLAEKLAAESKNGFRRKTKIATKPAMKSATTMEKLFTISQMKTSNTITNT